MRPAVNLFWSNSVRVIRNSQRGYLADIIQPRSDNKLRDTLDT